MYHLMMVPSKRKALQNLLFFVAEEIYSSDRENNPNYRSKCDQSAIKLLKTLSMTLSVTFVSATVFFFSPFLTYVMKNEIQFPLPVLFPFTELKSPTGFVINIASQIYAYFFGAMANISIEIIQFMLKNSVWATTVAICHSIDEFSTILENHKFKETEQHFRNILVQIQDLERYVQYFGRIHILELFLLHLNIIF